MVIPRQAHSAHSHLSGRISNAGMVPRNLRAWATDWETLSATSPFWAAPAFFDFVGIGVISHVSQRLFSPYLLSFLSVIKQVISEATSPAFSHLDPPEGWTAGKLCGGPIATPARKIRGHRPC